MKHGIATVTDGLEITLDRSQQGTLMCLSGRVNIDSSPMLRNRLLDMLRGPSPAAVIVDLAEVSYMDTSGIATLVEGLKVASDHGTTLRLQGLHDRLLHLFEVTGMLALFEASPGRSASSESKAS